MRVLYIFPPPDDESFGPAPVLARQRRQGHEVYLLTLTRGEATSQREKYGYSKDEMGQVRYAEMQDVALALDLTGLTVLDFPDGALADLNPLDLEAAIRRHIEQVHPAVVVTYAVHGISGHPDHLVAHAVVKHVYCALQAEGHTYLKRLALFTLPAEGRADRPSHLRGSPPEAIDCVVSFAEEDRGRAEEALACYRTYQDVIEEQQPLRTVEDGVCFSLFGEGHEPPLRSLVEALPA